MRRANEPSVRGVAFTPLANTAKSNHRSGADRWEARAAQQSLETKTLLIPKRGNQSNSSGGRLGSMHVNATYTRSDGVEMRQVNTVVSVPRDYS